MSLPDRLGRLRRVSRLGAGGFATVWLYRDEDLDSPVAVKALADNWAQRLDVRERFLEEARILRRADSDHVVRVYDLGETDDGTPYFVMSYADAGTVADLLHSAPLPLAQVSDLVGQAAQGLEVLHRVGVVHRDVKPQNLLLKAGSDGEVRLMVADLGVAKALLHASGITQVVGTPAYMAPEQAAPGAGVDVRADVHALGAVAYHLLTGRPPREGGLASLLDSSVPPPASTHAPGIDPAVDRVLSRALAPDPDGRWPDVAMFAGALRAVATGAAEVPTLPPTPETAAPTGRTGRGDGRWLLRNRAVAAGAAVAVLVVATVLGVVWMDDGPGASSAGEPGSSTTSSSDEGIGLPPPWFEALVPVGSLTEYRNLPREEFLRVSTESRPDPARLLARAELKRVAVAPGFVRVGFRALESGELGDFAAGWEIRYRYLDDDQHREMRQWFLGAPGSLAGTVLFSSPLRYVSDAPAVLADGRDSLAALS